MIVEALCARGIASTPTALFEIAELGASGSGYRRVRLGKRFLNIPGPALRPLLDALEPFFTERLAVHPAAHGFVKNRSILTAAQVHTGAGVLVGLDLAGFYDHVTASKLEAALRGLEERDAALILKACLVGGRLPQGAPTSPTLANASLFRLDTRLAQQARLGWRYTRYADDMHFSHPDDVPRCQVERLIGAVRCAVLGAGHKLSKDKARLARRHQRQEVLGLCVNPRGASVRCTPKLRDRLRAAIHNRAVGRLVDGWNDEQIRSTIACVQMVEPARGALYLRAFERARGTPRAAKEPG